MVRASTQGDDMGSLGCIRDSGRMRDEVSAAVSHLSGQEGLNQGGHRRQSPHNSQAVNLGAASMWD